jgi:hypothetical protein
MIIRLDFESDELNAVDAVEKLVSDFRRGATELYFAVSAADDGEVEIIAADIRGVID